MCFQKYSKKIFKSHHKKWCQEGSEFYWWLSINDGHNTLANKEINDGKYLILLLRPKKNIFPSRVLDHIECCIY